MSRWGREIRFMAVSALVVLSLTGFSTGSHGSSSGGSSGGKVSKSRSGSSRTSKSRSGTSHSTGGGGCSSSSQDHDSYDDDDDTYDDDTYDNDTYDDDTTGDSGDETGMPPQSATVTLVSCATKKQPFATVELHNPNDQDGTFEIRISFVDAQGELVDVEIDHVEVPANQTATAKEYVVGDAAKVDHCEIDDLADPVT